MAAPGVLPPLSMYPQPQAPHLSFPLLPPAFGGVNHPFFPTAALQHLQLASPFVSVPNLTGYPFAQPLQVPMPLSINPAAQLQWPSLFSTNGTLDEAAALAYQASQIQIPYPVKPSLQRPIAAIPPPTLASTVLLGNSRSGLSSSFSPLPAAAASRSDSQQSKTVSISRASVEPDTASEHSGLNYREPSTNNSSRDRRLSKTPRTADSPSTRSPKQRDPGAASDNASETNDRDPAPSRTARTSVPKRETYLTPILCGRIDQAASVGKDTPTIGITREFAPFFNQDVCVYTALDDPQKRLLYRATELKRLLNCNPSTLSTYLSRHKWKPESGIFQASAILGRAENNRVVKKGSYYVSLEACKEFKRYWLRKNNQVVIPKTAAEKNAEKALKNSPSNGSSFPDAAGSRNSRVEKRSKGRRERNYQSGTAASPEQTAQNAQTLSPNGVGLPETSPVISFVSTNTMMDGRSDHEEDSASDEESKKVNLKTGDRDRESEQEEEEDIVGSDEDMGSEEEF